MPFSFGRSAEQRERKTVLLPISLCDYGIAQLMLELFNTGEMRAECSPENAPCPGFSKVSKHALVFNGTIYWLKLGPGPG